MPDREAKRRQYWEESKQTRQIRKQIKRRQKEKRVRDKSWLPDSLNDPESLDELATPRSERIMPRGERDRRRQAQDQALSALRAHQERAEQENDQQTSSLSHGVVVQVSTNLCRVLDEGRVRICTTRGTLSAVGSPYTNVVAVGDQVRLTTQGSEEGVIEEVLPRKSVLARTDVYYGHLQQVLVANADQLLIVASWRDPAFWPELVDRYLIAAERSNLRPLICLNKVDLAADMVQCRTKVQPYVDLGYQVILSSATWGLGIPELSTALAGQMTVLAGLSGVGKSSLLSVIQPDLDLRTGEINASRHEGRHTTTQVNLHHLGIGGCVIDTPGIREFGLSGLSKQQLIGFYPELAALAVGCRFSNCTHVHEPECTVRAAAQEKGISSMRYASYVHILDTLPD